MEDTNSFSDLVNSINDISVTSSPAPAVNSFESFLSNLGNTALGIGSDYYHAKETGALAPLELTKMAMIGGFILAGGFILYKMVAVKSRYGRR